MNTSYQADIRADRAATAGDLGPLAWVLGETRQSIDSANKLLKRLVRESQVASDADMGPFDVGPLRLARQQLHQAVGALEMVGQPIAARMVRGMEAAVQQWVQRPDNCQEPSVATLERAGGALMEYLEGQLRGRARPALGLFPQFRQVQQLAGAERIHPADLWDGVWRWVDPDTPPAAPALSYAPETRTQMDHLVLKIMRHADVQAAAGLALISLGLAAGETAQQPCIFWKLCGAFFEALGQQLTPLDSYAKRAASRVLVQYTSLARGDPAVSERLALDLLFFCAQARAFAASAAPALAAVRKAWGLEGQLAVDYEQQVFGLYDRALLAQARRRVEAMKENWSALADGDLARLKVCVSQFELITESLDKLHQNGKPLSSALTRVATQVRESGCAPSPELAMETAIAVLFLEASFADFQPGEASFASRMQQLAERLQRVCDGAPAAPLEPWMEELYRSANDRQTLGTVVSELRRTLGEIEQQLDQFFRNPTDGTILQPVPARMSQLRGVLSVLGLDQAELAVGHMSDAVNELLASAASGEEKRADGVFERIGNSLGALGFEIDMLGYQPALANKLFVYDPELGQLRQVEQRAEADDALLQGGAGVDVEQPQEPVEQSAVPADIEEGWGPAQTATHAAALQPAGDAPAEDDADEDMLDIFMQEAREVVRHGGDALLALRDRPADVEQQTIVRRAFHTLKGSARLIGLTEFGAAAWSMEQLLNVWLAENKPATDDLRGLAGEAMDGFARWVDDLAGQRADAWRAVPFQKAADALRTTGQRVPLLAVLDGAMTATADAPDDAVEPDADAPLVAAAAAVAVADGAQPSLADMDLPDLELPELEAAAEPEPPAADLDPTLPDNAQEGTNVAPEATAAGEPSGGELPTESEVVRQADAPVSPAPLLPVIEMPSLDLDESADADGALYKQIGDLRISTALYNVYLSEADEWSRQLLSELSEWVLELERPVPERAVASAHSLAGSSATVGFTMLSELARAMEHALLRLARQSRGTAAQAQALGDAAQEVRRVLDQFAAGQLTPPDASIVKAVQKLRPTEAVSTPPEPVPAASMNDGGDAQSHDQPVQAEAQIQVQAVQASAAVPQRPSVGDDIQVADAIDPDLFPFFEAEAQELLPRLSAVLRQWTGQPDDQAARGKALRTLHTLKGSARLAGAMRLGEMAHRTESAIELIGTEHLRPDDLAPLLNHLDELLETFRQLQAGRADMARAATEQALALPPGPAAQASASADMTAQDAAAPATAPRGDTAAPAELSLVTARAAASQAVRVPSQLLDRLVSQAGEVLSSRARLASEVAQLRSSLNDLTGNLERLRQQLRDVELQAEMQMQSRLAQSKDAQQNFDPLEFDRFTRMQELTRMMAESVNDVATVQRSLQRAVDASEDDLAAQAQQSRELQRDLLRTRMAEFESISARLYLVVRQACKETDKQVRLDIVGGSIEIDRAILERMTPAFEHLLRNGVVHGIEAPAVRTGQGKDPTGVMTIEVHQVGNDVSIEFRDDGAGLDLARLRERALQLGHIAAEQPLSDAGLRNLIFLPGLSTVADVTELAGRGVGLDVVRTEVRAIGGRIETESSAGSGSAFRLILPLTTAVTQVLMVRAGGLAVGVPANLVERVLRMSEQDLKLAYQSGHYRCDNEELPFFWAGALLQNSARSAESPERGMPVAIFRSADQRVAVHVDEVLGNQEVVIKPLGPQLARLPGLVAITALASGAVTLIYNPVALVAVYGAQARVLSIGAAAAPTASAAVPRASTPLVLVVDDSITVRRVTQRLLQREGYRVALATDGLQGLERLQAERPAVVLSDIEMPRMDGFDFVRNIRADDKLRDLPVIMITSRIAEKHRDHAHQLGVDHYIGKPYAEAELLGLIRSLVRSVATADVAQ